jgi:DNA-nicking Smr family endonuclease
MDDDSCPVLLPIEDCLDLHPFAPRDIPDVVRAYLEAARKAGLREVRLIHGRGHGVQRARVLSLLAKLPGVAQAYEAPPERGGWGATVVILAEAGSYGTVGED